MARTTSGGINTAEDLLQIAPNVQVEKGVNDIVDWIRNYDPNLDVMFLDPMKADSPFDAPWIVVEHCRDGKTRLVFSVWKMDESVKARIYAADTTMVDIDTLITKENEKARERQKKQWEDKRGEAADIMKSAVKAPTTFKFRNDEGELITLDDQHGIIKRDGKDEPR
jgi:hypothetical protein